MNIEDQLILLIKMHQKETSLHWSRNNFFLLCSSILLLALSQFGQDKYRIAIAISGSLLNIIWLLIQYRSNKYIRFWNNEINRLNEKAQDMVRVFPDLPGIPVRKLACFLPIILALFWIGIFILAL